jgi:hypothetical protein
MKAAPPKTPDLGARRDDPLFHAFDGQLDPGTKLMNIGLHGYSPFTALGKLANDPRHMSVALHEITHFVSLENTLGHLIGFLALRANSLGDGLLHLSESGGRVYPEFVANYCNLHQRYRLLVEAWRPLLEGLAVYAQTYRPDDAGDAIIEPLELLWTWKLNIAALGVPVSRTRINPYELDDGFLAAGYEAIRKGPSLWHSGRPLAACLELLDPERLRPYFLGHTYLRALQRCLARVSAEYQSGERFFSLIVRILRGSTQRILAESPQWDTFAGAERLYNWIEIVQQAKPARILALRTLDDNVDVLRFLETGEVTIGYSSTDADLVRVLSELVPNEWDEYAKNLHARHSDRIAAEPGKPRPNKSKEELVGRIATFWIRGTMSLNLSTCGQGLVAGWIPDGFGTKHALALQFDNRRWWAAANDDELARLVAAPSQLRKLDPEAMHSGSASAGVGTGCPILIDCFARYTSWRVARDKVPRMFPTFDYELCEPERRSDPVLMCMAPAVPAIAPCHLQSVGDAERVLHRSTVEMRRIISRAASPRHLSTKFRRRGDEAIGALLDDFASREDLAVLRVQAHVNRRIIRGLLGRFPTPEDLSLLSHGVGAFPEAAGLEALIVSAYGAETLPEAAAADRIRALNARSSEAIGKSFFTWDAANRRVSYCGLWGNTLGS